MLKTAMQIASDAGVFRPQDKEPPALSDTCEDKAPLQTQLDGARQIFCVQSAVDAPIIPAVQSYIDESHAKDEYRPYQKHLEQPEKKQVIELLRT